MKLEGDYVFDASVPEVWSALFDPVILAAVMPGCEKLDLIDGQYVGEIKVKVGPIQGKFTGKVDLQDKVEPRSYTMVVDGRGAPGFVKATAQVKLSAEGSGTRVHYDADAQIGGKIASVGQRLIDASARAIVAQSLEGLHTNIKLRAAAYREAAARHGAGGAGGAGDGAAVAGDVPEATPVPVVDDAPAISASADAVPATGGSASPAVEAAPATGGSASPAVEAAPATSGSASPVPATSGSASPAPATSGSASSAVEAAPATSGSASPAPATGGSASPAPSASTSPVAPLPAATAARTASAASGSGASAGAIMSRIAASPAVAFTPVKVKQSDLANAVAKEVASSLFPRSVLVAIIIVETLVIVWLLLRH